MNEQLFLDSYLKPSDERLDKSFTHPLPFEGLEKRGEFIIQGKLEDTFSTNIVYKYEHESKKLRLIDVYKCTQHVKEGIFVRLVGTMSLVRSGFPFLFLDAAVTNVSPLTQEREDVTTRVVIHMPQARDAQRDMVFDTLKAKAEKEDISYKSLSIPHMPDFWGPIMLFESKALDLQLIEEMRNLAGGEYVALIDKTEANKEIDYTAVKTHMVNTTSKNEGMLFSKMGFTVPEEAQAAFFSLMTGGVENPQ